MKKKTLELIEEQERPQALIINGAPISSSLTKTLKERGCEVVSLDSYSPTRERYDYIFLFDNGEVTDEVYENNLKHNGKFIWVLTEPGANAETMSRHRYKILKIGDPAAWNETELVEQILDAIFSVSRPTVIDVIKKEKATMKKHIEKPAAQIPTRVPIVEVKVTVEKKQKFNLAKIFTIFAALIVTFCISLSIGTYWYVSSLQKKFANLEYHAKSNNLREVVTDLKILRQDLKLIKNIYSYSSGFISPLRVIPYFEDAGILLDATEEIFTNSEDFTLFILEILPNKPGFTQVTENISPETLDKLQIKLANLASTLITSQAKLDKINFPYLPTEIISANLRRTATKLTSIYDILPVVKEIFFPVGPKIYLVLFQNNMELRPTGGFIGSFGLLTVVSGKILDFKIEDVYTADGQLKGHIDPPNPIRKYLGQPHFFLRDSNFDPDFAASGMQAAWFLQKELGKNVDGVIGVNLSFAQKLIQAVGPVRLSDFSDEEITADNFFYKMHLLSNANFFPGSTQKKDVLTAVANELVAKISKNEGSTAVNILPILKQAFEEKNIIVYLDNDSAQKTIENHGWAGRMTKASCVDRKDGESQQTSFVSASCLTDYLSIIESNLGVNKANYSVDKSTVIEKKIDPSGKIITSVTVSYLNSENTVLDQSATYVNYLRFFVPRGSQLVNLTLNNVPLNSSDIDTENYGDDKTIFGLLVRIAPGNRGVVKINYILPRLLTTDIRNYQFFYQKQAGDKNSPFVLSLSSPQEMRLTPLNFTSTAQREGEIYYTTDTSVDRVFAVRRD